MNPKPTLSSPGGTSALLSAVGPVKARLADTLAFLGVTLTLQQAAALIGPSSVPILKPIWCVDTGGVRRLEPVRITWEAWTTQLLTSRAEVPLVVTFAPPPGPIAGALAVTLALHAVSIIVRKWAQAKMAVFAEVAFLALANTSVSVAKAMAVTLKAAARVLVSRVGAQLLSTVWAIIRPPAGAHTVLLPRLWPADAAAGGISDPQIGCGGTVLNEVIVLLTLVVSDVALAHRTESTLPCACMTRSLPIADSSVLDRALLVLTCRTIVISDAFAEA